MSNATYTDAELLARSHRRRRSLVRITLGSLLVLLMLVVGGLALTSSGMSIEEAEAAYQRLQSERVTSSQAESVFGKPLVPPKQNRLKMWYFTKSSLDTLEVFSLVLDAESGLISRSVTTWTGWGAWRFRWGLFKWRLGFDPY
jgi:hypothetical protein